MEQPVSNQVSPYPTVVGNIVRKAIMFAVKGSIEVDNKVYKTWSKCRRALLQVLAAKHEEHATALEALADTKDKKAEDAEDDLETVPSDILEELAAAKASDRIPVFLRNNTCSLEAARIDKTHAALQSANMKLWQILESEPVPNTLGMSLSSTSKSPR